MPLVALATDDSITSTDIARALPVVDEQSSRMDSRGWLTWTEATAEEISRLLEPHHIVEDEPSTTYTWARPEAMAHVEPGPGRTVPSWVDEQRAHNRVVLLGRAFPPMEHDWSSGLLPSFQAVVALFAFDADEVPVVASESAGVARVPYPVYAEPRAFDRLLSTTAGSMLFAVAIAVVVGFGVRRVLG